MASPIHDVQPSLPSEDAPTPDACDRPGGDTAVRRPSGFRLTIRHLMGAVVLFACLLSCPWDAFPWILSALSIWTLLVLPVAVIGDLAIEKIGVLWARQFGPLGERLRRRSWSRVQVGRPAVFGTACVLGLSALAIRVDVVWEGTTWYLVLEPHGVAGPSLIAASLLGPFHAGLKLIRGRWLLSGEILWVWTGVLWSIPLATVHPHSNSLRWCAESLQLSLGLVLILVLRGARPRPPVRAWAHHLGWLLMEAYVVACGWFACPSFRMN